MPYADTETVILLLFITLLCMGCAWYEIISRKRPKKGREIGQEECAEFTIETMQTKKNQTPVNPTNQDKYSKLQVLGTQTATSCALLFKKRTSAEPSLSCNSLHWKYY